MLPPGPTPTPPASWGRREEEERGLPHAEEERGLTTACPGQVPGAADIHEGAWQPIWPAGILIEGPIAKQAWA